MLAAVYHGRRDVRVEQVPEPAAPGPAEVRLRVIRAALCGTDASEFAHGPLMVPLHKRHPGSGHQGPTIIGHEFVGRIESVGSAVATLVPGQRVVPGAGMWCGACRWCESGRPNLCARYYTLGLSADGGMAELVNVPALMCKPVPAGATDDAAAMAQPVAVALHAVDRARVVCGERVVLIGVGGVGLFILAGLVARRARVVALDVDERRLAGARANGATHAFDAADADLAEQLAEVLGRDPAGIVVEASGAPGSPALAQRLVGRGRRVVLVGIQKAPLELDLADLVVREVDLVTTNAHVCDRDLPEAIELLTRTGIAAAALGRVVELEAVVEAGLVPLVRGELGGKVVVAPPASAG